MGRHVYPQTVFFSGLVLTPMVNHTQEEHANHYTTVAVYIQCKPCKNCQVPMQYLIYLNKLSMLRAKITTYLNVCKYDQMLNY
jgi:hypothetical protein